MSNPGERSDLGTPGSAPVLDQDQFWLPEKFLVSHEAILPDVANTRGMIDLSAATNGEFRASVLVHGILCALLVARRDDGRFDLIDGHRRLAIGISAGVTHFPVQVMPGTLTAADRSILQVVANLQRADVPDLDVAAKLSFLLTSQNWTQKFLARQLGKSEPTVTRLLQLDRLAEPVKDLVRTNRLPATVAVTLASLPETDQVVLAGEMAAGTLTRDGLAKAVRNRQPGRVGRKSAASTRTFRFSTGRGEEVVVKSAGELTPSGLIEKLRHIIAAAERADKQGLGTRVIADILKATARPTKDGPTT